MKVKRNQWFLLSTKFETKHTTNERKKIKPNNQPTCEIYKSFSFIHLIAVFDSFFSLFPHVRSFYWFESAKKLIFTCDSQIFSVSLGAMTINFNILLACLLHSAHHFSERATNREFDFSFSKLCKYISVHLHLFQIAKKFTVRLVSLSLSSNYNKLLAYMSTVVHIAGAMFGHWLISI